MGVTMESKNFSADMGSGGFNRFRKKVASLSNSKFGEHYVNLNKAFLLPDEKKDYFFEKYNVKTNELIEKNIITVEIANFCFQSDC